MIFPGIIGRIIEQFRCYATATESRINYRVFNSHLFVIIPRIRHIAHTFLSVKGFEEAFVSVFFSFYFHRFIA